MEEMMNWLPWILVVSMGAPQLNVYRPKAVWTQGNSPSVEIAVPALNLSNVVPLTSAEQTTVQGWITALQNNIEAGLVSLALIAGAQSGGI
jgi:hypothetical protein